MRILLRTTLAALVLLGAAGCGDDDTATKTETVTVTVAGEPPGAPATTATTPATAESAGPPLPSGVVGVDGRYQLASVSSDYDKQNIGVARFASYDEPSNASTKCVGERCSVTFRFGLKSGGSKTYTLRADPSRERTYVGTGRGQITCLDNDRTKVSSRERVAVRAGSATDVGGRQVAGRLSVYVTITAPCPSTTGTGEQMARFVTTLRGPREP